MIGSRVAVDKTQARSGCLAVLVGEREAQALRALAGRGKKAGQLGEQPPGREQQHLGFFDRRRQRQRGRKARPAEEDGRGSGDVSQRAIEIVEELPAQRGARVRRAAA